MRPLPSRGRHVGAAALPPPRLPPLPGAASPRGRAGLLPSRLGLPPLTARPCGAGPVAAAFLWVSPGRDQRHPPLAPQGRLQGSLRGCCGPGKGRKAPFCLSRGGGWRSPSSKLRNVEGRGRKREVLAAARSGVGFLEKFVVLSPQQNWIRGGVPSTARVGGQEREPFCGSPLRVSSSPVGRGVADPSAGFRGWLRFAVLRGDSLRGRLRSDAGPRDRPGPPGGLASLGTGSFCGCERSTAPRAGGDCAGQRRGPGPGCCSQEVTCEILLKHNLPLGYK